MRLLVVSAALMLLAACQVAPAGEDSAPVADPAPYERVAVKGQFATPAEHAACEAVGGEIMPAGLRGWENCIQTLPDAGQSCTGEADCIGRCILGAGADDTIGKRTDAGACQATDNVFGCYATVSNGRVDPTLCVD